MQMSLFAPEGSEREILPLPGAEVIYYPNWLGSSLADKYLAHLRAQLPWRQDTITLYGREHLLPRLQSWHGDPDCRYRYSGIDLQPAPWEPVLLALKQRCSQTTTVDFNSVLANWYRGGADSMGMHADDEPELGVNPTIASVSLGQPRPFVFRHRVTKARYTQVLDHGSLLVMAGATQQMYLHGIAKTARPISDRINLTFRHIRFR